MGLSAPGTSSSKPFSLNCQRVTWSPTMVRSWICGGAVPAAMARCRYLNSVCRGASRGQYEAFHRIVGGYSQAQSYLGHEPVIGVMGIRITSACLNSRVGCVTVIADAPAGRKAGEALHSSQQDAAEEGT